MANDLNIRGIVIKMVVALILLFVAAILLGWLAREPIKDTSEFLVDRFGIAGLFVSILCVDSLPGLTNEPLLFVAISGGLGYWPILLSAGAGSTMAGVVGWIIGGRLRRFETLNRMVTRYRMDVFFEHYGARTIALAALTPLPFAVTTWAAGASGVKLRTLLLGCLWRFPKTWFYLTLIDYGWNFAVS
ncbi:MAG: VTT domain-containing protein [Planctomycetes bacterium]|nr:VTT domain-containing protein [Planctomycetota bacterium]